MKAIPVEFLEKARMAYVDTSADPEDLAYVKGWNDALMAVIDNAPMIEVEGDG